MSLISVIYGASSTVPEIAFSFTAFAFTATFSTDVVSFFVICCSLATACSFTSAFTKDFSTNAKRSVRTCLPSVKEPSTSATAFLAVASCCSSKSFTIAVLSSFNNAFTAMKALTKTIVSVNSCWSFSATISMYASAVVTCGWPTVDLISLFVSSVNKSAINCWVLSNLSASSAETCACSSSVSSVCSTGTLSVADAVIGMKRPFEISCTIKSIDMKKRFNFFCMYYPLPLFLFESILLKIDLYIYRFFYHFLKNRLYFINYFSYFFRYIVFWIVVFQ